MYHACGNRNKQAILLSLEVEIRIKILIILLYLNKGKNILKDSLYFKIHCRIFIVDSNRPTEVIRYSDKEFMRM